MTSAIGVAILAVAGIWLFGSLVARWTGALLVGVGSVGLASTGNANGFLLVTLGVMLWLVGHLLYRMRRGEWKSRLAERACLVATAIWRSNTLPPAPVKCSHDRQGTPAKGRLGDE